MNNHERQFGGFYDDSQEMREDRNVMNEKKMPEYLQVNTHYAEKSLHNTDDDRIKFNNTSADFNMPFEDEELLAGKTTPKLSGVRQQVTNQENKVQTNMQDNQFLGDGHKFQMNSDLMAGGGKPQKTEAPDGLFSDFNKMLMLSGILIIVIFIEAYIMFSVL